jgi:3-deoxy-D-manno-octulosonate 8-phosphate phosphatase (KDO 8-P phosphatase)
MARSPTLESRAKKIRLVLLDVDGVLTDGTVLMHGDGTESKAFHIRDGAGIVWAMRAGLLVGLLSARESATTIQRATQLGIPIVAQGVSSKSAEYARIIAERGLSDDEVAFMGDDVLDIPVLERVGLAGVPSDAVEEAQAHADWVSTLPGGHGAVREFLELILKAQDSWDAIVRDLSEQGAR